MRRRGCACGGTGRSTCDVATSSCRSGNREPVRDGDRSQHQEDHDGPHEQSDAAPGQVVEDLVELVVHVRGVTDRQASEHECCGDAEAVGLPVHLDHGSQEQQGQQQVLHAVDLVLDPLVPVDEVLDVHRDRDGQDETQVLAQTVADPTVESHHDDLLPRGGSNMSEDFSDKASPHGRSSEYIAKFWRHACCPYQEVDLMNMNSDWMYV